MTKGTITICGIVMQKLTAFYVTEFSLQCFDAVGWAAGRASVL